MWSFKKLGGNLSPFFFSWKKPHVWACRRCQRLVVAVLVVLVLPKEKKKKEEIYKGVKLSTKKKMTKKPHIGGILVTGQVCRKKKNDVIGRGRKKPIILK
jgi:hypothetical protein